MEEHHNPLGNHDYLSIQHLERYLFALSLLSADMHVLDIACGAGYGTAMFLQHGCSVVGGDYDVGLVETARRIWDKDCFVHADAMSLPFDDESFDAVVSFETIEHVTDGRGFLSEMYRVLRPGGIFICSTPNVRYTAHPLYHVKEYRPDEFFALVDHQFQQVTRYGQYFRFSDRLHDIFNWHMVPPLLYLLQKTGTKELLKLLLGRKRVSYDGSHPSEGLSMWYEIQKVMESEGSGVYNVIPFAGEDLLRIMVVVARKKAR